MDDLISDFLTETSEGLDRLDLELVRLEQNPDDQGLLGSIFRIVHTIKGTCGFLGLPRLEAVAHSGENILGKIRDGHLQATPEVISLVLECIDTIKSLLSHLEATEQEAEGDDSDLINRLNAAAEGTSVGAASHAASAHTPNLDALFEQDTAEEAADMHVNEPEHVSASSPEEATPPPPAISQEAKKEAVSQGLKVEVKADANKGSHSTQSIRVNLDVLEGLMQMVSELVLTRNQLLQMVRAQKDSEFAAPLQRLSHITSELQERVMKTRMQPIGNAWAQFPRLIRDLALELNKKIELRMIGEDTELDRQLIESIKDPLTHMVRNSADHGLEIPAERLARGKSETGIVTLKAYHQGGHIIIEIADDGRGLNIEKIKAKAITNGIATEADLASLSDQQIQQFIFKAGFSTAEKVTSISGRGVGMDVVKTNIEKISGTIELRSTEGRGSTFLIKIPLTLAIMPVLIVECHGEKFGIPQINVLELLKAGPTLEYSIETINGAPVLRLRESLLPLISLPEILHLTEEKGDYSQKTTFIVACEVGGHNFGIIVDRIFDTEEIVVKPVAPVLKSIDVYSGSTLLGDGSVIMILDPNGLAKATGEVGVSSDHNSLRDSKRLSKSDITTSFVVFRAGSGAPKAVPLELVSRLEEVDVKNIECSGGALVVQYRDSLMYLMQIDPHYQIPQEGQQQIIVFADRNKIMGLVVEEIIDIVEHPVQAQTSTGQPGFLGAMVVGDKTTDLLDIGYYFHQTFGNMEDDSYTKDREQPSGQRLLLIDDSPFFRKFIPPTLIENGYQVTTLESAKKAIDILSSGTRFDLIITDINMPDMTGEEFTKACKSDNRFQHIPIIALSSQNNEQIIANPSSIGLSGYVSKTNHEELLKMISHVLSVKDLVA